jgi:hypothetical protein
VNPGLNQDFQDALGSLGSGAQHAGRFSVLRVLISHPATPHADTLERVAKDDGSYHLMATVNLLVLAERYSEKKILDSLMESKLASTSNGPQRNPGDELEDASSLDDGEDSSGLDDGEDSSSLDEDEDSSNLDEDEDPSSAHADKKRRLK